MAAFNKVIAHPRSLSARRELCAHLRSGGDPRAELMERQLADHDGLPLRTESQVLKEIDKLIATHGKVWAGRIAEITNGYWYELGLVAALNLPGDDFVQHAKDLVGLAPIVHLVLQPPVDLVSLAATPALAQISTLTIMGGPWLNDEAVIRFAKSPYVRGLRAISFRGGDIGSRGLEALGTSPNLRDVVYIELTGNPCSETGANGARGMSIMDRYYLVGDAGLPYLQEAYDAAAVSYDTEGIHNWPPSDKRLAYSE